MIKQCLSFCENTRIYTPSMTKKYWTRIEVNGSGKWSSLIWYDKNYICKLFNSIGPLIEYCLSFCENTIISTPDMIKKYQTRNEVNGSGKRSSLFTITNVKSFIVQVCWSNGVCPSVKTLEFILQAWLKSIRLGWKWMTVAKNVAYLQLRM